MLKIICQRYNNIMETRKRISGQRATHTSARARVQVKKKNETKIKTFFKTALRMMSRVLFLSVFIRFFSFSKPPSGGPFRFHCPPTRRQQLGGLKNSFITSRSFATDGAALGQCGVRQQVLQFKRLLFHLNNIKLSWIPLKLPEAADACVYV